MPDKVKQFKYKSDQNQQSSRITIGNWELPAGIILAPMAGVTDSAYRRITRRFGSGLLYTECISAEGVRRMGAGSLSMARFHPDERPIALQLFGSAPQQFRDAAAIIAARFEPDMIDINCGCPVRKMVRKNSGGYLMQYPDLIGRIVEATREGSGLPVSVKLRRGYKSPDETAPLAAQAAEETGAALVAIHGRYVRNPADSADWDVIGRVKSAVKKIPVVGNGDVTSILDVDRMMRQTGCDRVMIGRAALGNPWIFRAPSDVEGGIIFPPPPTPREIIDILLEHYRLMMNIFPEPRAVRRMRKHFGWYTRGLKGSTKLRAQAMKIENFTEVMELLMDARRYV